MKRKKKANAKKVLISVIFLLSVITILSGCDGNTYEEAYGISKESSYMIPRESVSTTLEESIYEEIAMTPEEALDYFVQQARSRNLHNYRLRIYYYISTLGILRSPGPNMPPNWMNPPFRDLLYSVIVTGEDNMLFTLALVGLGSSDRFDNVLIPTECTLRPPTGTCRVYYIFESNEGRKIFDVAISGDHDGVLVNGIEFEWNDVFYEFIRPHLPLRAVENMDRLLEWHEVSEGE